MAHDYETSKKIALKTIILLAVITVLEVLIALFGKGYIIEGVHIPVLIMGGVMIALSLYKAIKIVFEFMHMKYELPGLAKTVLLPLFLLVWGVIAFLYEGTDWGDRRELIDNLNRESVEEIGLNSKDLEDIESTYYI